MIIIADPDTLTKEELGEIMRKGQQACGQCIDAYAPASAKKRNENYGTP